MKSAQWAAIGVLGLLLMLVARDIVNRDKSHDQQIRDLQRRIGDLEAIQFNPPKTEQTGNLGNPGNQYMTPDYIKAYQEYKSHPTYHTLGREDSDS